MKDQRLYLIHIRECIEKIEEYTGPGESVFSADSKTQDAVVRNFEIIGEAAKRIFGRSPTDCAAHSLEGNCRFP